ncbi:MAG TPA: SDR family oxidoreductase [Bryobacteraceae bacterium]
MLDRNRSGSRVIELTGKVALVTGGSRGIGRACALRLAEAGADVAVNYVGNEAAARETAERIRSLGRRAATVKADVSEPADVAELMEFVTSTFGRLDVLVSNAATGGFRPLLSTTELQFESAMNTNVRALLVLVQAALPLLRATGGDARVIALSSEGAVRALPSYGLIGASKAALESLIRSLALEAGPLGITFNTVRAGLVETDSTRALVEAWKLSSSGGEAPTTGIPPDDVADAVLFLASDLSKSIQGQTLVVGAKRPNLWKKDNV